MSSPVSMLDKLTDALGLARNSGSAAIRKKYATASDAVRSAVALALLLPPNEEKAAVDVILEKLLQGVDAMPAVVKEAAAASLLSVEQREILAEVKCSARDFVDARGRTR